MKLHFKGLSYFAALQAFRPKKGLYFKQIPARTDSIFQLSSVG